MEFREKQYCMVWFRLIDKCELPFFWIGEQYLIIDIDIYEILDEL